MKKKKKMKPKPQRHAVTPPMFRPVTEADTWKDAVILVKPGVLTSHRTRWDSFFFFLKNRLTLQGFCLLLSCSSSNPVYLQLKNTTVLSASRPVAPRRPCSILSAETGKPATICEGVGGAEEGGETGQSPRTRAKVHPPADCYVQTRAPRAPSRPKKCRNHVAQSKSGGRRCGLGVHTARPAAEGTGQVLARLCARLMH